MKTIEQLTKTNKRALSAFVGGKNKVRKFKLKNDVEDNYNHNYRKNVAKTFMVKVQYQVVDMRVW